MRYYNKKTGQEITAIQAQNLRDQEKTVINDNHICSYNINDVLKDVSDKKEYLCTICYKQAKKNSKI
jgi:hypothetical protein